MILEVWEMEMEILFPWRGLRRGCGQRQVVVVLEVMELSPELMWKEGWEDVVGTKS